MEVNVNFVFKTLDGKPIEENPNVKDSKKFTLKMACTNALLGNYPDEKNINGTEKARRYALAIDIHKSNGKVDLESEDITLIKELIAKVGSPLIVGQAYAILDPPKKK